MSTAWIDSLLGFDRNDHPTPLTLAAIHVSWDEIWDICSGDGVNLTPLADRYGDKYEFVRGCSLMIRGRVFQILRHSTGKAYTTTETEPWRIAVCMGRSAQRFLVHNLVVRILHGTTVTNDATYKPIVHTGGFYFENDDDRTRLVEHLRQKILDAGTVSISKCRDGTELKKDWYVVKDGVLMYRKKMNPVPVSINGQVHMVKKDGKRTSKQIGDIISCAFPDIYTISNKHTVYDHISTEHTDHSPWNLRPMTQRQNNMVRNTEKEGEKPSFEHCSQYIPDRDPAYAHLRELSGQTIQDLLEKRDIVKYGTCYFHKLGIVYNLNGTRKCIGSYRYDKYIFYCDNSRLHTVHRSMAIAFNIPKPDGADRVNHKISDPKNRLLRQDNRLENLEWTDAQGNANVKRVKVVIFKTDDTTTEKTYDSMHAASSDTGIHLSSIQRIAAASKNRGQPVRGIHRETEMAYTVSYE
jgi:hypothetical protein